MPTIRLASALLRLYVVQRGRLDALRSRMAVPLRTATKDERTSMCAMLPGATFKSDEELVTHAEQGAVINARLLSQSLLCGEKEHGKTTIETQCRINDIYQIGDEYLVSANGREWRAANVALAVGPWDLPGSLSSNLYPAAELRCKRVAALHVRLPVDLGDPLLYFLDDDLFVLPHAKGQALVSFRRNAWDMKPDLLDGHADEEDIREGRAALAARDPRAAQSCSGGQAFCDLYAPNRLPLVRTSPTLPGIVAVQGGSGSGVRLARSLSRTCRRRKGISIYSRALSSERGRLDNRRLFRQKQVKVAARARRDRYANADPQLNPPATL